MDGVEKLYNYYDILAEAKDKISEHEDKYLHILSAVRGTSNEKRLAAQFIPRFFKHFPDHFTKAIDAEIDLCEDEDVAIRKQAIKDFPTLCSDAKEFVGKIADVLTQLLLADEPPEVLVVHSSLVALFKQNAKGTLSGVFSQIVNGEEAVRERAIKFLCSKWKTLPLEVATKEVEEFLFQECKKVMQDVTGDEFASFMGLLSILKTSKAIPGQQALVDLVVEQAELDKVFDHTDPDALSRLMHCLKQAMPFFSTFVSAGPFISYICLQVIPELELLAEQDNLDMGLEILKLLAEISPHNEKMQNLPVCVEIVFNKLLEYLHMPPEDNTENESLNSDSPNLHLSHVECLLYTFHQLAKKHPEFLASQSSTERVKDFKLRLQFLARGIQIYIKKLREALAATKGNELKTDENKLKLVALRTTSNINSLIKDLFHVPPSYKCAINLSWKTPQTTTTAATQKSHGVLKSEDDPVATGVKRPSKTPIIYDKSEKVTRMPARGGGDMSFKNTREIYTPPGGKYSTKVDFQTNFQYRGRGRGFGYGRSRGRGRGSYNYYY